MVFGIVASVGSAIVGGISSAVSSIGSAVSGFCANILPRLGPIIEKGVEVFGKVGSVAQSLLRAFGIFKLNDKIDDIGDRAMQGAETHGIKPENFDRFDEYLERIRELELDPEKSEKISPEKKVAAGLAIAAKGLEERFNAPEGSMGNLWVWNALSPDFFTVDRLKAILDTATNVGDVIRYFEGRLDLPEAKDAEKTLLAAERSLSPKKSEDAFYSELDKAADIVRNSAA